MAVKAVIKDNVLTVTVPVDSHVSKSTKSIIVATSGGNRATTAQHKGQPVVVGLNAYIPNPDYVAPAKD
ncbi:hypothetical protein LCGC14_0475800 [marine sediment metagenome]|uniref:Uncharacterized protein n=1 Tax=marine sediment metagenome TaxID=412755 RepID=A0A0F9VJH9_9ZZZZ